MKTLLRYRFFVCLAFLTACGSSMHPNNIMQQWIAQSSKKLIKSWKGRHTEETWGRKGIIICYTDKSFLSTVTPDKVKDSETKIDYAGPEKNDSIPYWISRRFYADSAGIIRKWEIIQTSENPTKKPRK
jgi:hypothetical protein